MTSRKVGQVLIVLVLCASSWIALLPGDALADTPAQPDDQQLQGEIEQYVASLDATYGVSVVNLNDESTVAVNDEVLFPTASLYKLLVMYRVFLAVDRGDLSLNDTVTITDQDMQAGEPAAGFSPGDTPTVGYALNRMITISSNAAAYALARVVRGWDQIFSAPADLEMSNTSFTDDFWSTPNDVAHFFHLLANQSLVSRQASYQMYDLLLGQTINDRIPAKLPDGVQVAHKTGELPGVRNDGGIVRCPGVSYIVVVMSSGGDPSEQIPAEAQISRLVYDHYCQ